MLLALCVRWFSVSDTWKSSYIYHCLLTGGWHCWRNSCPIWWRTLTPIVRVRRLTTRSSSGGHSFWGMFSNKKSRICTLIGYCKLHSLGLNWWLRNVYIILILYFYGFGWQNWRNCVLGGEGCQLWNEEAAFKHSSATVCMYQVVTQAGAARAPSPHTLIMHQL